MNTLETVAVMILGAVAPVLNDRLDELGFDAGEKARDVVAESNNTLDDTALESVKVLLNGILRGIDAPTVSPATGSELE